MLNTHGKPPDKAAGHGPQRDKPIVLLIEDQRIFRQIVVNILSRECNLLTAANGADGMRLYAEHLPDVVFLDLDLPDTNGQIILRNIIASDPDAFVVMLTANQIAEEIDKSIANGAKGYVVKPFTRQRIEEYLDIYRRIKASA